MPPLACARTRLLRGRTAVRGSLITAGARLARPVFGGTPQRGTQGNASSSTGSASYAHAPGPSATCSRVQGQCVGSHRAVVTRASATEEAGGVDTGVPHFNLPLAVALAGAAFEAYLEPAGGVEGFKERTLNGTATTFVNKDFLTEAYEGLLYVKLHSAEGLRAADVTGSSDPYVVLSVGSSTAKSTTVLQNLNPKWEERFCLFVKNMDDLLRLRVFDSDFLKSDDDLGAAAYSVRQLQEESGGKPIELSLPLRGPQAQGAVQLRATFIKFSDFKDSTLRELTADKMVVPKGGEENLSSASSQVPSMVEAAARIKAGGLEGFKEQVFGTLGDLAKMAAQHQQQEEEEEVPNPWKVLAEAAGWDSSNYTPVAFVENHASDTQVWLYRNQETREAIVAFRGTEQIKWKDFATDLNLTPSSLNPERSDSNEGLPLTMRVLRAVLPTDEMMVHQGFLDAYDSVRQPVVRLLDSITGTGEKGKWTVHVTGHSLGGALATLCAYELSIRQGPARQSQHVNMYTYGAPRVGNRRFAEAFNSLVPDSWRITNSNDIIPSVPRLLGYAHVKHSVRLTPSGQLLVQGENTTDVFGEGKAGMDVIQEYVEKIQAEEKRWDEVFDEIKSAELQIFDTLVTGKALEEHMETFYLETLKSCVSMNAASAVASMVQEQLLREREQAAE